MHGRPFALGPIIERAAAVLDGWYAGQATAQAATEILFGDVNPSGKLAVSLPRSAGHVPSHYAKKPYAARYGYLFEETGALFPFGFGLSYTGFAYSEPRLDLPRTTAARGATLEVDITNTGSRPGTEIVQLYVRDEIALPTRPRLELRDFARVSLLPGETKTVRFRITKESLGVLDEQIRHYAEPGWFTLTIGPSSATGKSARLEIVADEAITSP
jgi:beta-glucosidase